MNVVKLGEVPVGAGQPPYIIAEVGSNHNGDMDLCRRLIDAAAAAGAHAVKFQSWTESSLIAKEEYERNPAYSDTKKHFGSLREMVKAYQFTPEMHREAIAHCRVRGITFCSSVFSPEEADLLERLDVPFFKIASMDVVNLPLLDYVARKGRPVVISTGMATLAEIEQAVETVRRAGNAQTVLLHCVSIYPPDYEMIHLRNLKTLSRAFDVPVGFSDHTLGTAISLAAIALGAAVIEKHFTLDKDMPGWDHAVSADPEEMKVIVAEGKHIFTALGSRHRVVTDAELAKRRSFRRSLVARRALSKGHVITVADLDAKRPGSGIGPNERDYVVGRTLNRDVGEDELIRWKDLQ
ncbi:MAG TPA: N-acetylneuraminate synthase family protein [Gemmatimonadales bacterium]|jgi:N,N'-diacetyllegionaminate synthase|nr:N-acetylneuraminate synthase family protein [Gemmatimonadales bacterium]